MSALPLVRANWDCAIHISNCPFSNGMVLRTAPPALIGALVGNKIRWSGKLPKKITSKYTMPIAAKRQDVGITLGLTSVSPRNTRQSQDGVPPYTGTGSGLAPAIRGYNDSLALL